MRERESGRAIWRDTAEQLWPRRVHSPRLHRSSNHIRRKRGTARSAKLHLPQYLRYAILVFLRGARAPGRRSRLELNLALAG